MKIRLPWLVLAMALVMNGCQKGSEIRSDIYDIQRRNMVRWDLKAKGIKSSSVLTAVQQVPRHLFLFEKDRANAYTDADLPIAQFIDTPKPYVVAKTIELLNLTPSDKVLEIGTGRGYQTALMAELAKEVYTIEIIPQLFEEAKKTLEELNYKNVFCRLGDGYAGWPENMPFDAILVSPSGNEVPKPLLEQLAVGGRLVMPIGNIPDQTLVLYRKTSSGLRKEKIMPIQVDTMEGAIVGRSLRLPPSK